MEIETKWWGWGDVHKSYDLTHRPHFWPYLRSRLDIPDHPVLPPPSMDDITISPPRLSGTVLESLKDILPVTGMDHSKEARLIHAYGKSYHDLIRIRKKIMTQVPDVVLFPENETEIEGIINWAATNRVALVPWGGGTSVVGGVEAVSSKGQAGLAAVDLKRMNRILTLDRQSLLADCEAGIRGPELEQQLQKKGLTLAHYPESFEFSSLGGWVAARSAGQQSTKYGKIEDMVESIRLISPSGMLETPHVPAAANGPDLDQLILGSEGILGVISRVRVRLKPLPERKQYTALLFRSFDEGAAAVQKILQSGLRPATIRLSDAEETDFVFSLLEEKSNRWANAFQTLGLNYLKKRGFLPHQRSFMILGLEGTVASVKTEWRQIRKIIRTYRPFNLGEKTARQWYDHRFENPYLRDILMNYDILVDTLETATEWENFQHLYEAGRKAILGTFKKLGIKGVVTVHLSHVYPTGASLYFIILATPHAGKELNEWWEIKRAASDAIVQNGGTISHHHGIGLDHRPWLLPELGTSSVEIIRKLKQALDPEGLMNPKKLLPDD
ncbi:MAG: FAD-binding oxidoreductase [Calditrichaeota bacterium]|nr:FAD-binding oxidoreductase [Calditrichota bacterium]